MGTLPPHARVEVVAPASPDAVWAVLADVTRTGEWSHECRTCEWVDGATGAVPGARFRGLSAAGKARWSRVNEIVTAEPGRELAWRTVRTRTKPDSTLWRFRLEPVEGGTRIVQTFDLEIGPVMSRLLWLAVPAHRDRRPALAEDLRRLGAVAAADEARPAPTRS